MTGADAKADDRVHRDQQRVTDGLAALTSVLALGQAFWGSIREFGQTVRVLTSEDDLVLSIACSMPRRLPSDKQAARLIAIKEKCIDAGFDVEVGSENYNHLPVENSTNSQ